MEMDKGLIRPEKRKSDPEIGPDAIMALIPSDLEYLVKISKGRKITTFNMNFFSLYQVIGMGRNLGFAGPFLGSPQAVMGLEKLIALGAERIWVLGWCGSLISDLLIGDLVIPSGALSEEGTSKHYPIGKRAVKTNEDLNVMLEECLKKRGIKFKKGEIWTTDAPYRETPVKIGKHRDIGALAVDMEMSALITVSIYRKVKLTGLLVVSDELFDLKWKPGFSNPKLDKSSKLAGEVLMEMVSG
jgi:purine-nucleoside phosphorylase